MREGVIELTPEGQVIFVNPAAATLLGQREEKILSSYLHEFFATEHAAMLKETIGRLDGTPLSLGEEDPLPLNGRQISMDLVRWLIRNSAP